MRVFRDSFIVAGLLTLALSFVATENPATPGSDLREVVASGPYASIAADNAAIFDDTDALSAYVVRHGPRRALAFLDELDDTRERSCHDGGHEVGYVLYELYGRDGFSDCTAACQSGCYHGVLEEHLRLTGIKDLAREAEEICADAAGVFIRHQCMHGIGHGLMMLHEYRLPEALMACDKIRQKEDQTSCYTGAFMENIVGGLIGPYTDWPRYLTDDPRFPCNAVGERYQWACWFLQTSRMRELLGDDFSEIANQCAALEPSNQKPCFQSLGRDVGNANHSNPEAAAATCAAIPESDAQAWCTAYAALDGFWDAAGAEYGLRVCMAATGEAKSACYRTIGQQAGYLFEEAGAVQAFCTSGEEPYQEICLDAAATAK